MVALLAQQLNNSRAFLRTFRSFSHGQKTVVVVPAVTLALERKKRSVVHFYPPLLEREKFPRILQRTYIYLIGQNWVTWPPLSEREAGLGRQGVGLSLLTEANTVF